MTAITRWSPSWLDPHGNVRWQGYRFGYTVEAPTDGVEWVTVVDRTDNHLTDQTQQARFTALGRYVRVTITDLSPMPPARAGLAEVEVLGTR